MKNASSLVFRSPNPSLGSYKMCASAFVWLGTVNANDYRTLQSLDFTMNRVLMKLLIHKFQKSRYFPCLTAIRTGTETFPEICFTIVIKLI